MDKATYALVRQLEIILTINPTGCGGYEQAFAHAQRCAEKGLLKHKQIKEQENGTETVTSAGEAD